MQNRVKYVRAPDGPVGSSGTCFRLVGTVCVGDQRDGHKSPPVDAFETDKEPEPEPSIFMSGTYMHKMLLFEREKLGEKEESERNIITYPSLPYICRHEEDSRVLYVDI